jgi:glycosyltransferase involved in cell wall biosynthesis
MNGIHPPEQQAEQSHGDSIMHIGSVGRLVPVKRFEVFVETAAIIRRSFPAVRFSILGDGPDRALLLSAVRRHDLVDWFTIADPVGDPWPYYRSLDLYVNTSESEGLPLSVLEAMAAGVPVVAAAVGGIPEIIGENRYGRLVHSKDAAAFASACAELINDSVLRKHLGIDSKNRVVAEHSAAVMARRYRRLYESSPSRRLHMRPALGEPTRTRSEGSPRIAGRSQTDGLGS